MALSLLEYVLITFVLPVPLVLAYDQCKNPLFETHWAGKTDIPTLTAFPRVNTNLRTCPTFNERASCCQQGFETEQSKFFNFWRSFLQGKFWHANAHRLAVLAASASPSGGALTQTDKEQLDVVKQRYADVLAPDSQSECLTGIMTYVAGMICFSCRPEWFQYSVIARKKMEADKLLRIRMAPSVCVDLWAACSTLGGKVAALKSAIRDSRIARSAYLAEENFDMLLSQRQLCNWAHDSIALHPFKQLSREEQDFPTGTVIQRRLDSDKPVKRPFDVMDEGKASGFSRQWQGMQMISASYGVNIPLAMLFVVLQMLV